MQQTDDSIVKALLDSFRWLAEHVGINRAIGIAFALLLIGIGWRVYNDRRKDSARIEETLERNRTIHILERELIYHKARELARATGLRALPVTHALRVSPAAG